MTGRRCRLGILASHPIQYFTPVYRRLAARDDVDVEVLYYRDFGVRPRYDKQFGKIIQWDTDQLGGYPYRFLRNLSPIRDTFNPLHALNPGALRAARGFDAIWLNGYLYPSNWLALAGASFGGAKLLLRSELWLDPGRRPRRIDPIRDRIIRWWVRRADALLYIGQENRAAYEYYGGTPDQLVFSPYSIDVDRIREARPRTRAEQAAIRRELGVPEEGLLVLFVGKLTGRKHPEVMLSIAREIPDCSVALVGSGPEEDALRATAAAERLDNVHLAGFVNQSALPRWYAAADVFVMPSEREPWGLVLNEAMAAGLPAVVTDQVGAAADLITHGETGFVVVPGAWEQLIGHVRRLAADESLRARIGAAARGRAEGYGYDQTAAGVIEALERLSLVGRPAREVQPEEQCASRS